MTSTISLTGAVPMGSSEGASFAWTGTWASSVLESTAKGTPVLVVSDDALLRNNLQQHLVAAGYEVELAVDGADAIRRVTGKKLVVLMDLQMLRGDDLECLRSIRLNNRYAQIVVMVGADEARKGAEALKMGAYEMLTKPFQSAELLAVLRQAAKTARMFRDYQELRAALVGATTTAEFTAVNPKSQALLREVERLAKTEATVLITGDAGTGKSSIARLIHQNSSRSQGPFIVVNCGSLSQEILEAELFGTTRDKLKGIERPGRFELADGGTLVLNEITNLPLEVQLKLLAFLQNRTVQRVGSQDARRVDVRLIITGRRPLSAACKEGRFREDLLQRLNAQAIEIPALRDRVEDLPQLVETICKRIARNRGNQSVTLGVEAIQLLRQHSWAGNLRELENVLERAAAASTGDTIDETTLKTILASSAANIHSSGQATGSMLAGRTLDDIEKQAIIETLRAYRGNKARSARILGISEKSIYNKMRRLGIPFDLVGSA